MLKGGGMAANRRHGLSRSASGSVLGGSSAGRMRDKSQSNQREQIRRNYAIQMSNKLYFKEEPRRKGDFDKPPEFGAPKTSH